MGFPSVDQLSSGAQRHEGCASCPQRVKGWGELRGWAVTRNQGLQKKWMPPTPTPAWEHSYTPGSLPYRSSRESRVGTSLLTAFVTVKTANLKQSSVAPGSRDSSKKNKPAQSVTGSGVFQGVLPTKAGSFADSIIQHCSH